MRRLSSVIVPRYDRWITLGFVAMAVLAFVAVWHAMRVRHTVPWTGWATWMALVIAIVSKRNFRVLASDVADEAWIDGGELVIHGGNRSVRLPLSDIVDIDVGQAGRLVTLALRHPCALGSRVRFIAPARGARDIRAELKRRIAEARRHP